MIDDVMNKLKVKRGSELPHSKLNESLVIKIRDDYQFARDEIARLQKHYSAKGLAEYYGVHVRTMEKALSGETWSHIA